MNRIRHNMLAAAALLAATACVELPAQGIRTLSQSESVRRVYAPIIETANRSVVEVVVDGETRVLGTVVAPDLVVTKYSELTRKAKELDQSAKLACTQRRPGADGKQGTGDKQQWTARHVGFDRPADLALLRLQKASLSPVQWRDDAPPVGAFTASPDGTETPLGIGVLASAPYQHTQKRAFLGIRFANSEGQPALLAEVVAHGAARAAGLLAEDIVIEFQGKKIERTGELRESIRSCQPGDTVTVKVKRGDAIKSFEVKLGTNNNAIESGQEDVWGDLSDVRSGFQQVLQHDTVLKPQDCGGPLVDLDGKVLGVNIARAGRVETLALPAPQVKQLVRKLLAAEKAGRASAGQKQPVKGGTKK